MYILVRGLYIANFTHTHHLSHTHTNTTLNILYVYTHDSTVSSICATDSSSISSSMDDG